MAGSLNKVQIIGNLGKDPEVRTMASGTKVANLSIATSETWNDKQSGERKERTEWHRVSIYNERLAEVAEKYLTKGRKVYIEGALETRKYTDNNGDDKYTTEVVLRNFRGELVLLDSRQDSDDDRSSRGREEPRGGGGREGGRDGGRDGGREDRGRDGRAAPRSREEPRGGHEDWGRDNRRASNGSGRDAPRGRDDDRRGGAPAWDAPKTQTGSDLDDEIPF